MTELTDKINQVELPITGEELFQALNKIYLLCSISLTEDEKFLFRYDIDYFYYQKGRWIVHNTFAGGIIFLREPETIYKIDIQFRSEQNDAIASVVYSSEERNARNVKYKPNAGQIESMTWNMLSVFPSFNKHQQYTKVVLMAIIGKFTKQICEEKKKYSWFMQFEKPFDINLFLDNKLELKYSVEQE